MSTTVKQALIELVQRLPESCTWDDAMYEIYVRQKIEAGIKDEADGNVVDHETVFEEFSK